MFNTRITRHILWAIPVLLVGWLIGLILLVVPAQDRGFHCQSSLTYLLGHGQVTSIAVPTTPAQGHVITVPPGSLCPTLIRGSITWAVIAGLIAGSPITLLTVRGFLWGASVLTKMEGPAKAVGPSH